MLATCVIQPIDMIKVLLLLNRCVDMHTFLYTSSFLQIGFLFFIIFLAIEVLICLIGVWLPDIADRSTLSAFVALVGLVLYQICFLFLKLFLPCLKLSKLVLNVRTSIDLVFTCIGNTRAWISL